MPRILCSPTCSPSVSGARPASASSARTPMSRKVLLVDADVNALGALASALRARGVTVFNASDLYEAVEQAFKNRPEVVLVAQDLDGQGELAEAMRAVPEIAGIPTVRLVRHSHEGELEPNE